MCMHWQPDPLPEPPPMTDLDRLCDDVLDLAVAWSEAFLVGRLNVHEARRLVQHETEKLRAVRRMMEAGL